MTEDELLYAVLDDKIRECENNNYLSNTNFLDIYQQSKAIQYLQNFILSMSFTVALRNPSAESLSSSPTMPMTIFSLSVKICRLFR